MSNTNQKPTAQRRKPWQDNRKKRVAMMRSQQERKLQYAPIQDRKENPKVSAEACRVIIPKRGKVQNVAIMLGNPAEPIKGTGATVWLRRKDGSCQNKLKASPPGNFEIALDWEVRKGDIITLDLHGNKPTTFDEVIMTVNLGVES